MSASPTRWTFSTTVSAQLPWGLPVDVDDYFSVCEPEEQSESTGSLTCPVSACDVKAQQAAYVSARKWLCRETAKRRKPACKMSPMDEASYFEVPTVNVFGLTQNNDAQIVLANPMRVGIIIAASTATIATTTFIRPYVIPTQANGVFSGIQLVFNASTYEIHQFKHGPLATAPWYAVTGAGAGITITVIEIVLSKWPQQG